VADTPQWPIEAADSRCIVFRSTESPESRWRKYSLGVRLISERDRDGGIVSEIFISYARKDDQTVTA
jgi:hypothetical protein